MNKRYTLLSLFALLLFIACTGFKPVSSGTVLGTVSFGTPQEPGHGACVGRGICDGVAGGSNENSAGTTVAFQLAPDNSGLLIMSFSLSELKSKQPEQVANFTDGSGQYNFDAAYALTGDIFSQLNLLPDAQILPTSANQVVQDGDNITVYVVYSHS